MRKESLADKPLKYVLKASQRYLSIGYDLAANHLTMKLQGVAANKFPLAPKSVQICHHKIVDTTTSDSR